MLPIEPTLRVLPLPPCVLRWRLKLWRLIVPAKPLPLLIPVASTASPTVNSVTSHTPPTLVSPSSSTRNSLSSLGVTPGCFYMSSHGLAQVLTLTICHLYSIVAVGPDGFHLSHCTWAGLDKCYRNCNTVLPMIWVIPQFWYREVLSLPFFSHLKSPVACSIRHGLAAFTQEQVVIT